MSALTLSPEARAATFITEPGIYDMPAARYHADPVCEPSLSSSVAEILLSATPRHAFHAHPRLNPDYVGRSSAAMDLGSVAHEIVLGKGGGYEVSPYDAYTTKDAKAWRDDAIARGVTPIKAVDHDTALSMAEGIRLCLDATTGAERAFLDGKAEAALIWRDVGGPWCRAMLDWLMDGPTIVDLKTTSKGLSDRALTSKIGDGLDMKAAFHLRGLEQLMPEVAGRAKWLWVFAETKPPFEARVVEMGNTTRHYGDHKAAFAIERWRECLAANRWPGYPREIEQFEYPQWASDRWDDVEKTDETALRMRPLGQPEQCEARELMTEIA